jgi:hypothetical protein
MHIPNESFISRKSWSASVKKLSIVSTKQKGISVNVFLYYAVFLSVIILLLINFGSRGAFGYENTYGLVKMILFSDLVILIYLGLNFRMFSNMPSFVSLICVWLFWNATTCLLLWRSYGIGVAITSLVEVLYCPLMFLFFFVSLKNNVSRFHKVHIFFVLLLVLIVPLFILVSNYQNTYTNDEYSALAEVYFILILLPWVLLYPDAKWKNAGILVIIIAVLWAMKRTAFIALVVALPTYYLLDKIRKSKLIDWRQIAGICVLAIILIPTYSYIETKTNGKLMARISSSVDDEGSGRLDIYKEVIKLQSEGRIDSWILGRGQNAVSKSTSNGVSAHSDWFEVMFDYGLVGLALYSSIHLLLLSKIILLIKQRSYYGPPMAASYALFFIISLTSHLVIYAATFAFLMAFWGSIFAISDRRISTQPKSVS